MGKSLTDVAKSVLMNENNMATLRPNGGSAMGVEPDNKGNEAQLVADAPKKPGEGYNVGAKAAAGQSKDTSVKQSVPAQKAETMSEEEELGEGMEEMPTSDPVAPKRNVPISRPGAGVGPGNKQVMKEEDDIEISEELQAFVDQCLEEGMSEEEIAEAIEENFELVTEEEELDEEEELEEEAEYEYTVDMSEHINALFANEDLSEDFKDKAIAIFEAAVTTTVQSELAALEEAFAATLEEEVAAIQEELSTNVDDYLNYVVENWVAENEVAIEAGLRTELTEEFISGLRNLFAENYIDIPEDKVSVVEELGDRVAELETKLNEEIERNVELNAILSESKKTEILYNVVEGLTATQAEKLKSLAENVEFTDAESYAQKVVTLRESYFPSNYKAQTELDSVDVGSDSKSMISEELQGPMAQYVKVLGKKLPN